MICLLQLEVVFEDFPPHEADSHGEVLSVNENDSVVTALKIMRKNKVSGIAVTNKDKELVTNLSASDFIVWRKLICVLTNLLESFRR